MVSVRERPLDRKEKGHNSKLDFESSFTQQDGVSVILCCHNSAERLPKTLAHLASQENQRKSRREIVLVDNLSTDKTSKIAQGIWAELGEPFPMVVIQEPQLGQAWARRAGVLYAQYSTGVFCDDDNWFSPNYLDTVQRILEEKPEVGVVGGKTAPHFNSKEPEWFSDIANVYAVGAQAPSTGDVTCRGYLWGAGMGFRLNFLKAIYREGINPSLTGRVGNQLTSGDDFEICLWMILGGYRLFYSEELELVHYLPEFRLTEQYRARFREVNTKSDAILLYEYFLWGTRRILPPPGHLRTSEKIRREARRMQALARLLGKPRFFLSAVRQSRKIAKIRRGKTLSEP